MTGWIDVLAGVGVPRGSAAVRRSLAPDRIATLGVYVAANLAGVAAFAYLLFRPMLPAAPGLLAGSAAPVLLAALAGLCLLALVVELGSVGLGGRAVAVLGVVVALNGALRFAEVALPGPGGFTPIFVLIVLAGYAYGARFGFLTGSLSLGVSAILTGGVGPWLPYQMYAAGWVGLTTGWLPGAGGRRSADLAGVSRRLVVALALFGAAWGFGYGLVMTIWDWSFLDPGAVRGATATQQPLLRYAAYYVATSLAWDAFAAGGTLVLLLAAGRPLLAAFRRFGLRFAFEAPRRAGAPAVASPAASGLGVAAVPTALALGGASLAVPVPVAAPLGLAATGATVHARAWLAWALGVAALASLTRNPALLLGAGLAVGVVRAAVPARPGEPALPLGRMAAGMVALAALYNGLMAHGGATVLFTLPAGWPLIGGAITAESLAYGALTGAALATLLAAFATLRRALSARDLVRLVPRAVGPLALVLAVALSFAPATLAQLAAVREAQAVRGLGPRGPRGWARLAVPLVVGGLERALALAESMTARGLAPAAGPLPLAARAALLGGVVAVVGGWLVPAVGLAPWPAGLAACLAGVALVVATLRTLARRCPHTDFRAAPWRVTDTLVALGAWLPVVAGLLLPGGSAALAWLPYPALSLPPLTAGLALSLAGLALPAITLGWAARARPGDAAPP